MVRYSRLEFRSLTRKYGADLCFTPMTIANCFCRSEKARQMEVKYSILSFLQYLLLQLFLKFSVNHVDTPLIAQFAANCATDFVHATQLIQNYVDGVDLNCGCPQAWAKKDGYGCFLLQKTDVIEDMMKTVRRNTSSDFSVSIKIRLLSKDDIKTTVELCRRLQSLNVTFITIHGRTPYEKANANFPVDASAIAEIKKCLDIPIIFNGDIVSLDEADKFYDITKCDGMMAARGILTNPALFAGYNETPLSCVQDWVDISHRQQEKMTFQNFHHHLSFMTENIWQKSDRIQLSEFTRKQECLEFLDEKFSIRPNEFDYPENIQCKYDDSRYKELTNSKEFWKSDYSSESTHGKYFLGKLHKVKSNHDDNEDHEEYMNSDMFQ